jgi:hypothetical protein
MVFKEEEKEHNNDKDVVRNLIEKFDVGLLVVGANKLDARPLKKTLAELSTYIAD